MTKKWLVLGLLMSVSPSTLAAVETVKVGNITYANLQSFAREIDANFTVWPLNPNFWHISKGPDQNLLVWVGHTWAEFSSSTQLSNFRLDAETLVNSSGKPYVPLGNLRVFFKADVKTTLSKDTLSGLAVAEKPKPNSTGSAESAKVSIAEDTSPDSSEPLIFDGSIRVQDDGNGNVTFTAPPLVEPPK
jgi:hypothetical protein